jgi:DNA polymerase V
MKLFHCGLFGISEDFSEKPLSLDERYCLQRESVFLVRAMGDSMAPEIKSGDFLVVDRAQTLLSGQVVTCYLNGRPMCKQYVRVGEQDVLRSFATSVPDVFVSREDQWEVFGVVVAIIRDLV